MIRANAGAVEITARADDRVPDAQGAAGKSDPDAKGSAGEGVADAREPSDAPCLAASSKPSGHKQPVPLDVLRRQVASCRKCPLADGRTQTVFGDGSHEARVLIIGEAPGKNEDLQGVPFVGAAGHKLDALLSIAGLTREEVFIANVLKCRPPGNRDPRPEEIQACTPFLREQTRSINPKIIVTLGNFATKFVLRTEVGITRLHGKPQRAGRFTVFPIYHPAAAIYDRTKQAALEEDFATLGRLLRQEAAAQALETDACAPMRSQRLVDDARGKQACASAAACANPPVDFDPVAYINEPRWRASRFGLERITELLERMGRPQDRLRFVHVAGTNGKGSVCTYIARILQEAGYRTGLFTSPYIFHFEERIRVNGAAISPADLARVTWGVKREADAMGARGEHPTEFELMCGVALAHFVHSGCQIVVLEVGLGGRLDSTNVIDAPDACVITRIGLDHTALLGPTEEAIACEKAGIVKPGAAVISWPQDDAGAMRAIADKARACGTQLIVPDFAQLKVAGVARGMRPFTYKGARFSTRMLGSYQPANAAVAIEVVRALEARGWRVPESAVHDGVSRAVVPGRFEVRMVSRACGGDHDEQRACTTPAQGTAPRPCAVEVGRGPVGRDSAGREAEACHAVETSAAFAAPAAMVESTRSGVAGRAVPFVIDGGHNPQGARVLAESLAAVFPGRQVVFVCGVLADKDYPAMIDAVLGCARAFLCASPDNPRALPAADLAAAVRAAQRKRRAAGAIPEDGPLDAPGAHGAASDGESTKGADTGARACEALEVQAFSTIAEAVRAALRTAGPADVVCAFGSLYSIAAVVQALDAAQTV